MGKKTKQASFFGIAKTEAASTDKVSNKNFSDVDEVINGLKPYIPVYLYRSQTVKRAAKWFCDNFKGFKSSANGAKYNGRTLFSVKSNPDERVIKDVFDSGIVDFDVASINEVRKVGALLGKDAKLYFMHPVKAKEVVAESYFEHNVRDFSFDSFEELAKIELATEGAKDLSLHLRIKMSCESSAVDLSRKFGVELLESEKLAKKARKIAKNFGVCFHVGSQCMDPEQYKLAIQRVFGFFDQFDVEIDSFDVGGGFPSSYPGMKTKSMSEYLKRIKEAISSAALKDGCDILCEPGRAMVAECESLLVRVEARKGSSLYINDGTYGGLFDAGVLGFSYFCEGFKSDGKRLRSEKLTEFSFYGITCDSFDKMKGPFLLPGEIEVGDYIEIYNLGAYSKNLRTSFNGYGDVFQVDVVNDEIKKKYRQIWT